MLDLYDELRSVVTALNAAGIPHALVGGLAYSAWVKPRATVDIDLLIAAEQWERIPSLLAPLGYLAMAAPMDFEKARLRRLTKIEGTSVLVVDFLLAEGPMGQAIARAKEFPLHDFPVRVALPQDIITLKEGRLSDQDVLDIRELRRLIDGESL